MRKRNLFVAAYLAMGAAVAFTSCSNDDVLDNSVIETPAEAGVQKIVLRVSNGGDGLTTRSGRPLFSSEADQNIDKVELIITKGQSKDVVYYTSLDWSKATDYNSNGHGKELVVELKGDDKLDLGGNYNIYAIGYSNSIPFDYKDEIENSSTDPENPYPDFKLDRNPVEIKEGYVTIDTLTKKRKAGFRHIAGFLQLPFSAVLGLLIYASKLLIQ